MESDRQRWNKRFQARPLEAPKPPEFFTQQRENLPVGRALDVASGDGAVALWFAEQGFDTTAVDISSVALSRLQSFAEPQGLEIATVCLDLDEPTAMRDHLVGTFDVIAMAHYKPSSLLLCQLRELLSPSGQLLLTTFNLQHHTVNGFSKRFCLTPKEFECSTEGLRCAHYHSVERNGCFMDDYRWVRDDGVSRSED
ncbi:MAG: class I SAM-dependent methyltransferase [Cellvibrionaceae bacterium]